MAIVYKTTGAEKLDHYYSGIPEPLADALRKGRQLMTNNPARLSDAAWPLENDGKLPPRSADDLDKYWLAGAQGAAKERLIRRAYEQAIELANTTDKPIETFMIAGASNNFEVHISEGKYAVTVFMFVTEDRAVRLVSRGLAELGGPCRRPGRAPEVPAPRSRGPAGGEVTGEWRVNAPGTETGTPSPGAQLLGLRAQPAHPEPRRLPDDIAEERTCGAIVGGVTASAQESRLPVARSREERVAADACFERQRPREVRVGGVPLFEHGTEHPEEPVGRTDTGKSGGLGRDPARVRPQLVVQRGGMRARTATHGNLGEHRERRTARPSLSRAWKSFAPSMSRLPSATCSPPDSSTASERRAQA